MKKKKKKKISRLDRAQLKLGKYFYPTILVLVLIVIGGSASYVYSQSQADAGGRFKPRKYSKQDLATFRLAAAHYWGKPQREDQISNAKSFIYSIHEKDVTCKPKDVKVKYVNRPDDNSIAYVTNAGSGSPAALRIRTYKTDSADFKRYARNYNKKHYCTMVFNLAYQHEIRDKGYACYIFIHEYGHMLGRNHNDNPSSPMYNGYVVGKGGGPESFHTSKARVLKNTLCEPFISGL